MNAYFSKGADDMHILWVVEQLPMLLHLSLFLFFGGLVIFLFNTDHTVFSAVMWWIGFFSIVYGLITVLPIIRHNSPYYAPLSRSAWFLYAGINYVLFKALYHICVWASFREYQSRILGLMVRFYDWMLWSVERVAEETASKRSSKIDIRIFEWTLGILGEDDSLEKFFEAVPGFFSSRLVNGLETGLSGDTFYSFWTTMNQFLDRTLSSNSVIGSVKNRRAVMCRDIMSMIPCPFAFSYDTLSEDFFDQAPVSIERLRAMARWCTHEDVYVASCARARVAKNLASMREQERDDSWIALASDVCGLATNELRENIAHAGNNVLLATFIDLCRRQPISFLVQGGMDAVTQIDIGHTLPRLQRDFCSLWNELVQEASGSPHSIPAQILRKIRHLYIALHQGIDAAPTAFSVSTDNADPILDGSSLYPLCDITSHRPDSTPHPPITVSHAVSTPTRGSRDASPYAPSHVGNIPQQTEQTNVIVVSPSPSNPTTSREIGGTSHAAIAAPPTNPVHSALCPTGASPTGGVAAVLQDATSSAVPKPVPVPASASAPAAAPDSFTPSGPIRNATLPCLHARGLVNTGSLSFVNAVLQLFVHSPPFWNLFSELGVLKEQREARSPAAGGSATPLVDATVRFVEEFVFEEKEPPSTQQAPQQAAGGKPKDNEDAKKELNAMSPLEPTYIYDAMKEKRQLKDLLVRPCAT